MAFIGLKKPRQQSVFEPLVLNARIPDNSVFAPAGGTFLLVFLRHVGCPFAEQLVKQLLAWRTVHPALPIFLVSHGDHANTMKWLATFQAEQAFKVVIDEPRQLYGQWGLGFSKWQHFLGPKPLIGVVKLWFSGIRNRSAAGTRWQKSGVFLVKSQRVVWCHVPRSAEDNQLPELEF